MPTLHWIGKDKAHHQDVPFRLLDQQYEALWNRIRCKYNIITKSKAPLLPTGPLWLILAHFAAGRGPVRPRPGGLAAGTLHFQLRGNGRHIQYLIVGVERLLAASAAHQQLGTGYHILHKA
ncbi:hypothetical protein E5K02_23285 [Hymenobacter metallicola]|uniref:Uncharacterized protein n=1 Tax=Hymenobacter metallicola TaxID=2563114 RepID=A0A4Z0PZC3_9BACT|nr:hypothetical protein E5K02_23285 [Hymenobacter metallicola]